MTYTIKQSTTVFSLSCMFMYCMYLFTLLFGEAKHNDWQQTGLVALDFVIIAAEVRVLVLLLAHLYTHTHTREWCIM